MGPLASDYHAAYDACLGIQSSIGRLGLPGVSCEELYVHGGMAAELGCSQWFMGPVGDRVNFIGHGVVEDDGLRKLTFADEAIVEV